jgi:thioredoxin reductase
VIVGAGPAGCAAAVQAKRLGLAPLLLDRTGAAGGLLFNAFSVENYPGLAPLTGPQLAAELGAHLARFDIPVVQAQVTGVARERDGYTVTVHGDSSPLQARCVILAPGTSAVQLDVNEATALLGCGLFYEVAALLAAIPAPGQVLVVGGGEAALDYALTLDRSKARVQVLVRGTRLRAQGRLPELVQRTGRIALRFETELTALQRADRGQGIRALIQGPRGEETLEADALLAAVGRYPAVAPLLQSLDVTPGPGVSTAEPGLFVAGDARLAALGQVGIAVGEGLAAAMAAAEFIGKGICS